MLINLAMVAFLLYSYLWIYDNIGFHRAILILFFFGFMGIGGMINTVAQAIQKKNFKNLFTEDDMTVAVLGLRMAREKEEKKWQRNEYLEREVKFLKFLTSVYNYTPKKGVNEIIAEEKGKIKNAL